MNMDIICLFRELPVLLLTPSLRAKPSTFLLPSFLRLPLAVGEVSHVNILVASSPQLDMDSSQFDAKLFVRHAMQTKTLQELLQLDNDLRKGIFTILFIFPLSNFFYCAPEQNQWSPRHFQD